MVSRIYLDNNGSTAVDPRVADAVIQDLKNSIGNPSSIHSYGQDARNRLTKARQTIATFLNVKPQEIIFTSGGTEGLNMIIQGLLLNPHQHTSKPLHIITSNVEHSAVFSPVQYMESCGCEVTYLPAGLYGAVSYESVKNAIRSNTSLIALMAVNNETGVKTDIEAIASLAQAEQIPFLVDGVALMGKELFSIPEGVSAMCFSGHKFHAPKGVGFAFVRNRLKIRPFIMGGEQEFNRRGGTENIPGIIGLAKAVEILKTELPIASHQMESLRDYFEASLKTQIPSIVVNGQGPRIVNTSNLAFPGADGELLLTQLDLAGIAVSHGSACASGALEPSRILLNMGVGSELASSSLRFSLSRFTTKEEIDQVIKVLVKLIH